MKGIRAYTSKSSKSSTHHRKTWPGVTSSEWEIDMPPFIIQCGQLWAVLFYEMIEMTFTYCKCILELLLLYLDLLLILSWKRYTKIYDI